MGILLGIDYGDKRIGLALSDKEGRLARRFLTLENNSETFSQLKDVIDKERIEQIVVGIPLGFNGESEQTRKVEKFISALESQISIPIEKMNEIFTSKMAQENLTSSGIKNIKGLIDQEAARIILQDHLDNNSHN